ncbi:MAG: iron-containing alcohol dehydrogenase [Muribaculaceae bacterium]|nr:iron-containing alcohol dehydrogenase [Muribaculaceae bacterium]
MNDFRFFTPTRYIFGREAQKNVGSLTKELLGSIVLIVFGQGSAKKSGLLDEVETELKEKGIRFYEFGGIEPNPTDGPVREGIKLCREEGVSGILAIGGGSVIDTAKAIAAGVEYEGDFWDFYSGKAIPQRALPIGVVLTIPAAGSEGSGNSVITKKDELRKVSIRTEYVLRPKFALLNPELTYSLPPYQTGCGIVDMIAHILERYFTPTEGADVSDRISEGIIKAIIKNGHIVMKEPQNYDARANIMWAGTLAHNGICGCGKVEDWGCHGMEHEISALYGVAHGAGLSVILLAYMRYILDKKPKRLADLGRTVFERVQKESDDREMAKKAMEDFEEFFKSIGMPTTFSELGIEHPDIDLLVEKVHQTKGEIFGSYIPITSEVSRAVYMNALGSC